jgi:chemotaxis protein methyltransferase CheR
MTPGNPIPLTEQDLARLRGLVTDYSGLDGAVQADSALRQAVTRRLAAHRLAGVADYWPLLQRRLGSNGELNSLVQLLTNKETFFFREMHHFDVLREQLLPELLLANPKSLRVWSAGCATGEEPYSLAILLLEYQARYGKFAAEVIATDIDMIALEKARRGRYDERAVRRMPDDLRQRYFSFDGEAYQILPAVAELVTFEVYNLAEERCDERRPGLTNLDVIFCRNVTIYFDAAARDRLNARLADSLREGGYLFVASAETMGHNSGRLELIAIGNTFLFQKVGGGKERTAGEGKERTRPADRPSPSSLLRRLTAQRERSLPSAPSGTTAVGTGSAVPPLVKAAPVPASPVAWHRGHETGLPGRPPAKGPDAQAFASTPSPRPSVGGTDETISSEPVYYLQRAQEAFQRHDFDAALHELDRIPAGPVIWVEVYRLRGAIFLQQERLAEAEEACQYLLVHDPWHADAHFLLGLIFRQQGQIATAIQSLKQAIYLQPSHRQAHFYLAETYRLLGLLDEARSEYENTLNALRMARLPEQGSTINLVGLEDDLVRQACEAHLRQLQGRQEQVGATPVPGQRTGLRGRPPVRRNRA